MPFKKGENGGAKGGARPGAGRPLDWLRERCQEAITKKDLVGFLERVAAGEDEEQVVSDKGEVIRVPAAIRDRHKAVETLLDRAYGKPDQSLTASVTNTDKRLSVEEELSLATRIADLLTEANGGSGVEEGEPEK